MPDSTSGAFGCLGEKHARADAKVMHEEQLVPIENN